MELPSELRKLLWANIVCYIVFIYIGIFVNLYIWEKNHSIIDVAWFNLVMFLIWPFTFIVAARLLIRYTIRLLLGLSSIFGMSTFVLLFTLEMDNQILWLSLIAMPTGIMWAFFSAAQSLCLPQFGKGKEFGLFFSAVNTITQMLSMIVPILSALVIKFFGFKGSFLLMIVFVACMLTFSFFLPKYSLKHMVNQEDNKRIATKKSDETPGSSWILLSSGVAGSFLQFQSIFVLLYTFTVAEDKLVIAVLNTLYTVCSLLGLYLYRKWNLPEMKWLFVSVLLVTMGFSSVLIGTPVFLVISNLLTTVGVFYFNTVWNSRHFRIISRYNSIGQYRLIIARESIICVTRVIMLVLIMGITEINSSYFYLIMVIALLSLVSVPLLEKKVRQHMIEEISDSI